MMDAVPSDLQDQKRLPIAGVRLNQAFNIALDMETLENASDVDPRPVEFPGQNHLPSMSMDDVLRLVDARIAEQQDRAFSNTLGMNSSTTSSWPQQNKRRHEEVRRDSALYQVKFPRHEQSYEDLGSGNTHLQGQTPLDALDIAPHHEITPGRCVSQDNRELAWKGAVAEPGRSQTPGVTVNGVALRLPLIKHPSYDQSAMASGCYPMEVLIEVSAGTKPMAAAPARKVGGKVYPAEKKC